MLKSSIQESSRFSDTRGNISIRRDKYMSEFQRERSARRSARGSACLNTRNSNGEYMCVCVCVCVRVRARVRVYLADGINDSAKLRSPTCCHFGLCARDYSVIALNGYCARARAETLICKISRVTFYLYFNSPRFHCRILLIRIAA
jgi:hypothetical protein